MAESAKASSLSDRAASVVRNVVAWLDDRGVVGTGLLVAVSGGADSVALLRAIHACRESLSLDLCVAHLDHSLRDDSQADAAWVQTLSEQLQVPIVTETVDVQRRADESGRGIEETARRARYEFFQSVAVTRGCSHVAVAHTADDQAETVLHHLIRGTGLAGLRGMPESRPLSPEITLVRPLLNISRATLLHFLDELGQGYRVDATNDDERFTRNRLRHSLLPLLREEFNPRVTDALARLARQVDDVQQIIEAMADRLLESAIIDEQPERVILKRTTLQQVERHLVREALRLLWTRQGWSRQRMGFDDWERIAALIQSGQPPPSLDLPHGLRVQRNGDQIELRQSPTR